MQEEDKKEVGFTFQGQRPEEKVADVINSHPYVIYPAGFRTILLYTVAASMLILISGFPLWSTVLSILLIIVASLYFASAYYGYSQSNLIITTERVFYIKQNGFFKRKICETDLSNIIDVSSETKGFFKTVLKYGDLVIRTAGAKEEGDIIVEDIPDPYYAQQRIAQVRPKAGQIK